MSKDCVEIKTSFIKVPDKVMKEVENWKQNLPTCHYYVSETTIQLYFDNGTSLWFNLNERGISPDLIYKGEKSSPLENLVNVAESQKEYSKV